MSKPKAKAKAIALPPLKLESLTSQLDRPRLRVVSADRERSPNALIFDQGQGHYGRRLVVEFWTEDEWQRMHPATRPADSMVGYLPGIGYIMASEVELKEVRSIQQARAGSWKDSLLDEYH